MCYAFVNRLLFCTFESHDVYRLNMDGNERKKILQSNHTLLGVTCDVNRRRVCSVARGEIRLVGALWGRSEHFVLFVVVLLFSKLQTFLNNNPDGNPLKLLDLIITCVQTIALMHLYRVRRIQKQHM